MSGATVRHLGQLPPAAPGLSGRQDVLPEHVTPRDDRDDEHHPQHGAGLARARKGTTAVAYLVGGGAVYLVLWVYGLVVDHHGDANFVPVNNADNWLHLSIGVVMTVLGVTLAGSRVPTGADGEPLVIPEE